MYRIPWDGALRLYPTWSVLRTTRVLWGLTQEELAAEIGTTRKTISKLERGRSIPSLSLALALGRRLDLAVEDLFPDSDLR